MQIKKRSQIFLRFCNKGNNNIIIFSEEREEGLYHILSGCSDATFNIPHNMQSQKKWNMAYFNPNSVLCYYCILLPVKYGHIISRRRLEIRPAGAWDSWGSNSAAPSPPCFSSRFISYVVALSFKSSLVQFTPNIQDKTKRLQGKMQLSKLVHPCWLKAADIACNSACQVVQQVTCFNSQSVCGNITCH